MKKDLEQFITANVNDYSQIKWGLTSINDISESCEDSGNELLFSILLRPEDENEAINLHESGHEINIRKLSDLMQEEDFANGDYSATIDAQIKMNTTIILIVSFLK